MKKALFYVVNLLTFYRLIVAPFLIYLVIVGHFNLFKWLLMVSFATDAIDGYLARRYKLTSVFGAHLDSIADDCTILAAIVGMCILDPLFILYKDVPVIILLLFYLVQNVLAFVRYRRPTSFHTYLAKIAAVSQAAFLLTYFFLPDPVQWLFYLMVSLTILDLAEEIILVILLPEYRTNVKGWFWLKKEKPITN
jgi:CDP-diacylglycerol--glycerol-3-phosphate 3-phosphatidyltransferase